MTCLPLFYTDKSNQQKREYILHLFGHVSFIELLVMINLYKLFRPLLKLPMLS